jgi:restriction endonuclease S subunit
MSKSVHQANINGTLLKNYEIPVPPIKEQEKIVAQIEELEKQIAEAQKVIDNSKQQKQAILDKYLK